MIVVRHFYCLKASIAEFVNFATDAYPSASLPRGLFDNETRDPAGLGAVFIGNTG